MKKYLLVLLALAAGGCASPSSGSSGGGENLPLADTGEDNNNDTGGPTPTPTPTDCEFPVEFAGWWCLEGTSSCNELLPDGSGGLPAIGSIEPKSGCWSLEGPWPFEATTVPEEGEFVSPLEALGTVNGHEVHFVR